MDREFSKPVQELKDSALEYLDLKVDDLKLQTAKGLSVAFQRIIVAVLFITIGGIVLMAAAFGAVLLIGKLMNDYAAGAFIVSGFFLLVLLVLFLFRKKLFIGSLVSTFVNLFFEEKR